MKNLGLIILLLPIIISCTGKPNVYVRDGRQYGITQGTFSGRWWNYYERGLSFSEGEFYQEATNDFQQAIKLRRKDKWRARTYGMHFVDYFPHRELGIVYYRMQRYPEAVRELENSLSTAENAKAKYFLNLVRKAMLVQTGRDISRPELSITSPPPKLITNRFTLEIEGVVTDDSFVSKIAVNNSPLLLELAKPRIDFQTTVDLKEGENTIRVQAEDLSGKTIEKNLQVIVDRSGPLVGVSSLVKKDDKKFLKFFVTDNTEIAALTVGNRNIALQKATREIGVTEEVENGLVIIQAKDTAGNLTVAEISLTESDFSSLRLPLLAALELPSPAFRQQKKQHPETDKPARFIFARALDTDSPALSLKNDEPTREVYDDTFLLEGHAFDASAVVSLKINGEQVLSRQGRQVFFTVLKPLQIGDNHFILQVTDSFGNTTQREIMVRRKVAKVKQIGSRMGLGILPFEQRGEKTLMTEGVYEKLISAFLEQQRFNVVERQKLEVILQELKLSDTPLVDPKSAVKVGRIMAADSMLIGTILAREKSIEVITRLIDTETSVVLAAHDVFAETPNHQAVNDLLAALAYKYKRDFPLLEGVIIEIQPDVILIDLGRKHKIKEHTKVICFREADQVQHPATGKVLGVESLELGLAKIEKTYPDYSRAEIIQRYQDLQVMDKVITK